MTGVAAEVQGSVSACYEASDMRFWHRIGTKLTELTTSGCPLRSHQREQVTLLHREFLIVKEVRKSLAVVLGTRRNTIFTSKLFKVQLKARRDSRFETRVAK